ncbi:hypothetical protein M8494_07835 [Serratia ureilytica]
MEAFLNKALVPADLGDRKNWPSTAAGGEAAADVKAKDDDHDRVQAKA